MFVKCGHLFATIALPSLFRLNYFAPTLFDVGTLARLTGYVPSGLLKFSVLAELFLPLDPVASVADTAYEGQKAGE